MSSTSADWRAATYIDKPKLVSLIASFETCVIPPELRTYKIFKAVSADALT